MFPDRWGSEFDHAADMGNHRNGPLSEPKGKPMTYADMADAVRQACAKALERIAREKLATQADDPEGLAMRRWDQR
ncbi:MAG: hypothetical protein IT181_12985 [Acidobacteria bacterium]|nr:hypothetical protein [Acidobacteriota bacterium]